MARTVKIWDGKEAINVVPADKILANREDLACALGDIFLVIENGHVSNIEVGAVIKSCYDLDENLNIEEVAEAYLVKRAEEEARQAEEQLTIEQLQEQVAMLSYQVMMMEADVEGGNE